MKELDLMDLLEQESADFAFICTYEFDPAFLERRLLRTKALQKARRIVVFMDGGRYLELINSGLPIRQLNRRYLVLPVPSAKPGGVFHPKLLLLLGAERTTLLVGSSNWTRPGLSHNLELCNVVALDEEAFASASDLAVRGEAAVRVAFGLFKRFAQATKAINPYVPLDEEFFGQAAEEYPWLVSASRPGEPSDSPQLLHTLDEGLWSQVLVRLQGQSVERLSVVSPYYDKNTSLFDRAINEWPRCVLDVTAQQYHSNLPSEGLSTWAAGNKKRLALWELAARSGRRLHAKAIAFQTTQATYWLVGSANFTTAALDGRNVETALWFSTQKASDILLFGTDVSRQRIKPEVFIPGKDPPPESALPQPPQQLELHSAALTEEGELVASHEMSPDLQPEVLKIRVRNADEDDFCLSLLLSPNRVRVSLTDDQAKMVHSAALCDLIAQCRGKEFRSNSVWLVQMNQLIKDPDGSGGPSAGSKNTMMTRQEFLTRLAELEKNGQWAEVIAFLNRIDIPFEDGSSSTYRRTGRWSTPRNPFAGDDQDNRLNPKFEGDVKELRRAIADFVTRHQKKLKKHIHTGTLDGIRNFFEIVRTLHRLLFTYSRLGVLANAYVLDTVWDNIRLFLGEHSAADEDEQIIGFLEVLRSNVQGEEENICKRLEAENVPAILVAALHECQKLKSCQVAPWANPTPPSVPLWLRKLFKSIGLKMPDDRTLRLIEREHGLPTSM
jgi:hypothetical protein